MTSGSVTKKDILDSITNAIENETELENENLAKEYSSVFDKIFTKYLQQLKSMVENIHFFDVEECWEYTVTARDTGVSLELEYISDVQYSQDNEIISKEISEIYTLAEIKAPLLTIEEYAQRYNVTSQQVMTWIQDCRIRSAIKLGNEWRIPELAQIQDENSTHSSEYMWNCTLTDLAEGYDFINKCDRLTIEKMNDAFQVVFWKNFHDYKVMHCDNWERKKIEIYFIENPLVTVDTDNSRIYCIGVA